MVRLNSPALDLADLADTRPPNLEPIFMVYFSADQDDTTSMKIYRGMTSHQWETRQGVARKGEEREAQFHAGDTRVSAGDTDIYVGRCVQNALTFTAMDSSGYRHSWLSFTKDKSVAAFFALNELDESGSDHGVVVETTLQALRELGIAYAQNDIRVPWEQEISVDLYDSPYFPESAIIQVHHVPYSELWRVASDLQSRWGGTGAYTRHAFSL